MNNQEAINLAKSALHHVKEANRLIDKVTKKHWSKAREQAFVDIFYKAIMKTCSNKSTSELKKCHWFTWDSSGVSHEAN